MVSQERSALEIYYLEKLRCLAIGLRKAMKPTARLVIGGALSGGFLVAWAI
jgi:hypothetical protein